MYNAYAESRAKNTRPSYGSLQGRNRIIGFLRHCSSKEAKGLRYFGLADSKTANEM
jgi:hypothetical protein